MAHLGRIAELPGVVREWRGPPQERLQARIECDALPSEFYQVVHLAERLVVPDQEGLQCLLRCLLTVVDRRGREARAADEEFGESEVFGRLGQLLAGRMRARIFTRHAAAFLLGAPLPTARRRPRASTRGIRAS